MNKITEIRVGQSLKLYNDVITYLREIIKGSEFENHLFSVGGCVRDKIMNNVIKDIDLVIDLPNGGIKFVNWVHDNELTNGGIVIYETYGTAMFKLKEFPNIELECVQTRSEQYHDKNSRNPETSYGSIEEDCYRRDLTINSLYYNISTDEVIDITGNGINDIKNHIIRTPCDSDKTYTDDPLRILRCIRFATRYGWTDNISEDTFNGMIRNVDRLSIITQERITDEFNKIICDKNAVKGLELIRKIGAMKYIIPELEEAYNMEQGIHHFGTVWEHTLSVVDNVIGNMELRLIALLHDIGKIKTKTISDDGMIHFYKHDIVSANMSKEILRKMKYPNSTIDIAYKFILNHMRTKQWGDKCEHMKDKSLRKLQHEFDNLEQFQLFLELVDADNNSHAKDFCMPNQVNIIFKKTMHMVENGTAMFKDYKLPVDGEDIMEFKGLKPSKEVKLYLDYLLKLAYNNPNITKEECLKNIKNINLC